jgi:type I restriction enzyme S subunit
MPDLPEGWMWALLRDVVESPPNINPSDDPDRKFGYVDISSICNRTFRLLGCKQLRGSEAPSRARRPVQAGDVLFSNVRTYLRNIALVHEGLDADVCSTGFTVLRPTPAIESRFLFRYVLTDEFLNRVTPQQTGTHYPATSDRVVLGEVVPLPPIAEQKRIVAKVEELLARVHAARARLASVPAILKRFRQAVLAAACSGRLTSDWRDNNPGHEPASTLLQKIRLARAAASAGRPKVTLSDQNPDSDTEALETSIPEGWTWCRVEEIASVRTGGTPSRKEPSYWGGGVPWISSGEVANCRIGATREAITEAGLQNSNAKMYPRGTVLIAMIGEGKTRGQTAILDIDAATNQNVAALVFDSGHVEPEYFWHWALGEYERHRAGGRGGNYPALNGRLVRKFPVPLPPLAEQKEIVRKIKGLFDLADAIESRLTAGTARAEKLTQAVLAKAFQGELVPTEAELARAEGRPYEPAFAILARLHSSRRVESLGVERGARE